MAKKKTARIEIVTTPELKEQVQEAADKNKRSLNSYVEIALEEKLRNEPEEAVAFASGTNPLPEIKPPKEDDEWLNS